jgi:hypothetical protein
MFLILALPILAFLLLLLLLLLASWARLRS